MSGRVRLVLAWAAFAAWVGWLGWQAARYGKFPVVSRAQLLTAQYVIIGSVVVNDEGLPDTNVKVVEVLSHREGAGPEVGTTIQIANLRKNEGINGRGDYVIPLIGPAPYRVAPVPRSPLVEPSDKVKVYPDVPAVRAQVANRS